MTEKDLVKRKEVTYTKDNSAISYVHFDDGDHMVIISNDGHGISIGCMNEKEYLDTGVKLPTVFNMAPVRADLYAALYADKNGKGDYHIYRVETDLISVDEITKFSESIKNSSEKATKEECKEYGINDEGKNVNVIRSTDILDNEDCFINIAKMLATFSFTVGSVFDSGLEDTFISTIEDSSNYPFLRENGVANTVILGFIGGTFDKPETVFNERLFKMADKKQECSKEDMESLRESENIKKSLKEEDGEVEADDSRLQLYVVNFGKDNNYVFMIRHDDKAILFNKPENLNSKFEGAIPLIAFKEARFVKIPFDGLMGMIIASTDSPSVVIRVDTDLDGKNVMDILEEAPDGRFCIKANNKASRYLNIIYKMFNAVMTRYACTYFNIRESDKELLSHYEGDLKPSILIGRIVTDTEGMTFIHDTINYSGVMGILSKCIDY